MGHGESRGKEKRGETLGAKAKKGVVWSLVREGGGELLLFPASMVLARLLSPAEFGVAAAAGFFSLLAGQLAGLGLNAALVRMKELQPEHSSSVFVVNLAVGVLMWAALFFGADAMAAFYGVPEVAQVLRVSAFGFIVSSAGTVPSAILTRDMRFKENAMADWYNLAIFSAVSIVLAWQGFSYMSMVYGRVLGLAAMTVSRIAYSPWKPSLRFSWVALREILPFGTGVYAKRLLDYGAKNLDSLVVGKFYGMATLGIYDKAFSTVNRVFSRLTTGSSTVTFRVFAVLRDDPGQLARAYSKVILSSSLVALPLYTVLVAVGPQLMTVLFGDQWGAAALPFQILCFSGFLKLLNTHASSATQAIGVIWSELWRQVAYVSLIVSGLIALKGFGAPGAALAVLLATLVMTVMMHVLLFRVTQVRVRDMFVAWWPGTLGAVLTASAVLALQAMAIRWFPVSDFVLLAAQAGVATVVFAAFVVLAPLPDLRRLVTGVYDDLAPAAVKRRAWVRRLLGA